MTLGQWILLAFGALIAVLAIVKRHSFARAWLATRKFLEETKVEMHKVTWPTRNDIIASTVVVLVAVVFLTIFVTILDTGLAEIMKIILPSKGS